MRPRRAFTPGADLTLEARLLLSRQALPPRLLAQAHGMTVPQNRTPQPYPIAAVNAQYDAFEKDLFHVLIPAYLHSVLANPVGYVNPKSTLAATHDPFSGTLSLQPGTGEAFGYPTTSAPIQVVALDQTDPTHATVLGYYVATGRVGDVLTGVQAYDPNQSSTNNTTGSNTYVGGPLQAKGPPSFPVIVQDAPLPVGTIIQSTLPQASNTTPASATLTFRAALTQRANQMAQTLVAYFNSLPIQLPAALGLPRQPGQRNLIQQFVYNRILYVADTTSLLGGLLNIAPPTDSDGSLTLYQSAASGAIEANRTATIDGVRLIWAGVKIPPHHNYNTTTTGTGTGGTTTRATTTGV